MVVHYYSIFVGITMESFYSPPPSFLCYLMTCLRNIQFWCFTCAPKIHSCVDLVWILGVQFQRNPWKYGLCVRSTLTPPFKISCLHSEMCIFTHFNFSANKGPVLKVDWQRSTQQTSEWHDKALRRKLPQSGSQDSGHACTIQVYRLELPGYIIGWESERQGMPPTWQPSDRGRGQARWDCNLAGHLTHHSPREPSVGCWGQRWERGIQEGPVVSDEEASVWPRCRADSRQKEWRGMRWSNFFPLSSNGHHLIREGPCKEPQRVFLLFCSWFYVTVYVCFSRDFWGCRTTYSSVFMEKETGSFSC